MASTRREETTKKVIVASDWSSFWQRNSTRILIGATLGVLILIVLRYKSQSAAASDVAARAAAVRARSDLQKFEAAMLSPGASPELIAARRDQLTAQVMSELSVALEDSTETDTAVRADAYAVRGDLYWALANFPDFPEATTRPALAMKQPASSFLSQAETDYTHIIQAYPDEQMDWVIAQFGLAAIAENRADWDSAQKHYAEVVNRTGIAEMWKDTARDRQAILPQLRQKTWVGPYPATTQATTQAATQSADQTTLQATTQPSLASPATMPASMPASLPATTLPAPR